MKRVIDGCVQEVPDGREDVVAVSLDKLPAIPPEAMGAALMPCSVDGVVGHLVRLSLHKVLGSSPADRAVLIADYAEKLRDYPELAIFWACKFFRESDPGTFFPKLGKLVAVIEEIEVALKREPVKLKPKQEMIEMDEWKKRLPEERNAWHWDECIRDAEKMLALAKQNPHLLSVEGWEEEIKRRRDQARECLALRAPSAAKAHQDVDRFCEEG